MAKKDITKERIVYKPFEYPTAFDYWLKQQQAHWIHTEVPMMSDINDWKQNLTETEKNIIGSILKGFAQTETVVNDYWSTLVTKWFRKPEVIKKKVTFKDHSNNNIFDRLKKKTIKTEVKEEIDLKKEYNFLLNKKKEMLLLFKDIENSLEKILEHNM